MCDSGSLISINDNSVASELQLQGRNVFLSVTSIHCSQAVKIEIVPLAVSAHEKCQSFTTVQFNARETKVW